MLGQDVTIGMSLTGAHSLPLVLGWFFVVPLIKAGFVDWIVSTGANLYHDTHFAIGHSLHKGTPFVDDRVLRKEGVIQIYDILFDYRVLLTTDLFFRQLIALPEFQKEMSTAEFHYRIGKYVSAREKTLGIKNSSYSWRLLTVMRSQSIRQVPRINRDEHRGNGARRSTLDAGCIQGC